MRTGVFVPGGTAEGPLGISDYPHYPITNRHTAYEWAMALGGEIHPYADYLADLLGSKGDLTDNTVPGMQARARRRRLVRTDEGDLLRVGGRI
jgi:hypothetical protein